MTELYDVAIIGGGPAGASAAIYTSRQDLKTIILEKGLIGGLINNAPFLENYPGFDPAPGIQLGIKLQEQLDKLNVKLEMQEITDIDKIEEGFLLRNNDFSIKAKSVIITTGSVYRHLNVPGEEELLGKGVAYCATCDAPLFKDKTVAIIGGGDSAFRSAQVLTDICKKVYLFDFAEEFIATNTIIDDVKTKDNIELHNNTSVLEILGKDKVEKIKIKNRKNDEIKEIEIDGIFINIGTVPSSQLAEGLGIELDKNNFIKVDEDQMTNISGIFAAGDITGTWSQAIYAAGKGALTGFKVFEYLKDNKKI
ncbi:FAD-dependent oxidoreductase [Candidatus Micrarchaeota archaeon]|jgi:thioredoxin reductase (NADPH)|nr:FAD-dependent oxidoreductase [Candidatus Micrarchaeota archaeon]